MSWQPHTNEWYISQLRKEQNKLRDIVYKTNLKNTTGIDLGGLGGVSGASTTGAVGITRFQPFGAVITNIDQTGATTSYYDRIHATTVMIICKPAGSGNTPSATDPQVKWVDHTASDGQLLILTPQEGTTLTLLTGGNINISSDTTVTDNEIIYLQWLNEHPTDNSTTGSYNLLKLTEGSSITNQIKEPCRVATTGNNLVPAAIGSSVDGVTIVVGNRVLYKNQTDAEDNGIYVCSAVVSGVATMGRAIDFDSDGDVKSGVTIHVEEGTANGDKNFNLTTNNPITLGTTDLAFANLNLAVDPTADYTWTGDHIFRGDGTPVKFQGTNVNSAQTVIELGSEGLHQVKFIGEMHGVEDREISNPAGG